MKRYWMKHNLEDEWLRAVTNSTILCYNKSRVHSNYPHTSSHGISLQVWAADMSMDYGLKDAHYAMDDNELSFDFVTQIWGT